MLLKRRARQKSKLKIKSWTNWILAFLFLVVVLVAAFYFLPGEKAIWQQTSTTTFSLPSGVIERWNCGNMQIDLNAVKEAIGYYRFGLQRPASTGYKFEILTLTIINKADVTKEFSGYRVQLTAGGSTYTPLSFNNIESITLQDQSTINYSCNELALASISRFELNSGESSTGCKIFQILSDSQPSSISIYNTSGLICTIQV